MSVYEHCSCSLTRTRGKGLVSLAVRRRAELMRLHIEESLL